MMFFAIFPPSFFPPFLYAHAISFVFLWSRPVLNPFLSHAQTPVGRRRPTLLPCFPKPRHSSMFLKSVYHYPLHLVPSPPCVATGPPFPSFNVARPTAGSPPPLLLYKLLSCYFQFQPTPPCIASCSIRVGCSFFPHQLRTFILLSILFRFSP